MVKSLTKETNIMQAIRLKASKLGIVLWRNNVGAFKGATGRWIRYGIGGDGGSDLIGGTQVTVTQAMVGTKVLVFTAYEVKTPDGMKPKGKKAKEHFEEQRGFLDQVWMLGGISKFLASPDDL